MMSIGASTTSATPVYFCAVFREVRRDMSRVVPELKFRKTKKAAALLAKITGGAHSMARATL